MPVRRVAYGRGPNPKPDPPEKPREQPAPETPRHRMIEVRCIWCDCKLLESPRPRWQLRGVQLKCPRCKRLVVL